MITKKQGETKYDTDFLFICYLLPEWEHDICPDHILDSKFSVR